MLLEAVLAAVVAGGASAVVAAAVAPSLNRRLGPDPQVWKAKSAAEARAEAAEAQLADVLDLMRVFVHDDLPGLLAGRQPRGHLVRGASAAATAAGELLDSSSSLVAGEVGRLHAVLEQGRAGQAGLQQHTDAWLAYLTSHLTGHYRALAAVLDAAANGRAIPAAARPQMELTGSEGPFEEFARTLASTQSATWDAVLGLAARQNRPDSAAPPEVFVLLARRMHSLIGQAIGAVEALELKEEDPHVLNGLFAVDQLVIRLRRALEAQALLGGQTARRNTEPVLLAKTLRQAVAATEDYARVRVRPGIPHLNLAGFASPDIANLLAELCENATRFSSPDAKAGLRAEQTPAGLVIEVEDHGTVMGDNELWQCNRLLGAPQDVDVRALLESGHIGLLVVARYAERHRITVSLQRNRHGGTTATVLVPDTLISEAQPGGLAAPAGLEPRPPASTGEPGAPQPPAVPAFAGALIAGAAGSPLLASPNPVVAASPGAPEHPVESRPPLPRRQRQPGPAPIPTAPSPAQGAGDVSGALRPDRFARFISGVNAPETVPDLPGTPA